MKLLVDFGGVFAGGENREFGKKISVQLGVPVELLDEYRKEKEPNLWTLRRGEGSEDDFFDTLAADWNREHPDLPKLEGEGLRTVFYKHMRQSVPDTLKMLSRVMSVPEVFGQPDGTADVDGEFEMYIVSDRSHEIVLCLYDWYPEVFRMSDGEFWSCNIGHLKREPEFFRFILKELGGEPEEYLFIDSDQENLDQAAAQGFKTLRFENARQCENLLAQGGVVFYPEEQFS